MTAVRPDLHHLGLDPLWGVLCLTVAVVFILKYGQVGVGVVVLPGGGASGGGIVNTLMGEG